MNNNIKRIKQLEGQIAALQKLTSTDDYLAAGLTLGLHVGPLRDDDDYDINVELTNNLTNIILCITGSLKVQVIERLAYAKNELNELQSFLSERELRP